MMKGERDEQNIERNIEKETRLKYLEGEKQGKIEKEI